MNKNQIFTGLFIVIIFISSLFGQQTPKIELLGVAVKGNTTISENSIKVQSGLIEGKTITFDDIPNAVKRLFELRLFSDIQILLDKVVDQGAFIIIQVEEYPRLGKFELEGNKKISNTKINEELFLLSGKVLSPHLITESKRKIRKLYFEDGYHRVEIDHKIEDGEKENTKDLTFVIKENKKVRIKKVLFKGNQNFSESKLRRVMKDTKGRNLFLFRVGDYEKEKYLEDKDLLVAFYKKEGYRDFEILSDTLYYSENKKRMFIELSINEGPRYKYKNISFNGNTLFSDEILITALDIKEGDWYDDEKFQMGVYDRVNSLYMDRGYLFVNIQPIEIPVGKDEVDINLQIQENHKVYVSQVNIIGNDKTYENVVRRELKVFPGDIFSREALMRSQREIFMLNYFANVEPDVVPVSEKEIDVEIKVEEKSSDRANMSVSFSQMYGFIGGGGLEFNNFRGKGQQLRFSYQQGTRYTFYGNSSAAPYKSFSISFNDPWVFDTPNLVGGSVFLSERGGRGGYTSYYLPYDLSIFGGSLRYGRRFRWPDSYFRGTWMVNYANKKYRTYGETDSYITRPKTVGISVSQSITRDSRDRPEFPTKGSVFRWSSTLSGGLLGGSEDFHKHDITLEFYSPTFWKFVLFNHMELGVVQGLNNDSFIPPDEQYIMGGAGMIYGVQLRGYDDNSIRSNDPGLFGGLTLFKYSMEFRVPISENPTIYALAFADAGNVWDSLNKTDPFNLKRSAGVGVRFFMPQIGMIGVDLGYGFDDINEANIGKYSKPKGWKTHFIFGMPF